MFNIATLKLLDGFESYLDNEANQLTQLREISRINLFVGANNSGKSRFIRLLATQREYHIEPSIPNLQQINSNLEEIRLRLKHSLERRGISAANQLTMDILNRLSDMPSSVNLMGDSYDELRTQFSGWAQMSDIDRTTGRAGHSVSSQEKISLRDEIRSLSQQALQILGGVPIYSQQIPSKVYIPVLRGLRPLDEQNNDLYANRTRHDYFTGGSQRLYPDVFTGLDFYSRLTAMLLGSNSERKAIQNYQTFISHALFEGRAITLIPSLKSKVVVVKIGQEVEQPIHNLGDGIQSAIILSFLPYTTEKPIFFFIEEPEGHLHPGLQRKVLELFASDACKQHHFFLTTHSNHFLDLTIDVQEASVFNFRKRFRDEDTTDELVPVFVVEQVDAAHSSSLELLGVRNSSVFLVNATIWVEGITDRWYLRRMLNSYIDHLRDTEQPYFGLEEDVHYSFVEYGGGNITHWSFLDYEVHPIQVDRLCARAILIVDGDGSAKLNRKAQLEKFLGDRLVILSVREVENLLPPHIIKEIVIEYERTPERKLKDFEHADYRDNYLGTFIEDVVLEGDCRRKGGYAEDSGTLKTKVAFCERALPKIVYNELPPDTQEVVQKTYQFIVEQNT